MKPSDDRPIAGGNSQYGFVPIPSVSVFSLIESNIFLLSGILVINCFFLRAAVEHEVEDVSGEATAVN